MRGSTLLVLAAILGSMAQPASAQAPNDVQCLMVSNFYAKSASDANARKVAEATTYFFLGRVAGRMNESQLRASLAAQQNALKRVDMNTVMQRCARTVRVSAEQVQSLGLRLRQGK